MDKSDKKGDCEKGTVVYFNFLIVGELQDTCRLLILFRKGKCFQGVLRNSLKLYCSFGRVHYCWEKKINILQLLNKCRITNVTVT